MSEPDGIVFVQPDHPVCIKCVSSLHPDETCVECDGDGFVYSEDHEYGESLYITCQECRGAPIQYRCPTCNRAWEIRDLWPKGPEENP